MTSEWRAKDDPRADLPFFLGSPIRASLCLSLPLAGFLAYTMPEMSCCQGRSLMTSPYAPPIEVFVMRQKPCEESLPSMNSPTRRPSPARTHEGSTGVRIRGSAYGGKVVFLYEYITPVCH